MSQTVGVLIPADTFIPREHFTIDDVALLMGRTREAIYIRIKRGQIKAVQLHNQRREWRILPEEVDRILCEEFDGLAPQIGIFVLATASHQRGIISDELYQRIKYRTMNQIYESAQNTASQEFLKSFLNSRNIDAYLKLLYQEAMLLTK